MATEITDPIARHREETLQRLIREVRERQAKPGLPIRLADERRERAAAEQRGN